MAQIQARGYLRVGVDQNTYLWGYRDPVTGQLTGFDIDMLDRSRVAIFGSSDPSTSTSSSSPTPTGYRPCKRAGRRGGRDDDDQLRPREVGGLLDRVLRGGSADPGADNSTITGPRILAGSGSAPSAGSTSLQNLVAPGMPEHIQLWAVNDKTDCLVMLQQGQVDAISTDDAILLGLAAQDPNTKLVGPTFSSEPYGMAISKAHPDFTRSSTACWPRSGPTAPGRRSTTVLSPLHPAPAPAPPPATTGERHGQDDAARYRRADRRRARRARPATGRLVELDADVTRQLLEASTPLRGVTATLGRCLERHAALWRGSSRSNGR